MAEFGSRSFLPYAEEMKKTVDLKTCRGCDGISFVHEKNIVIPFCKYKWFGEKCKRKGGGIDE